MGSSWHRQVGGCDGSKAARSTPPHPLAALSVRPINLLERRPPRQILTQRPQPLAHPECFGGDALLLSKLAVPAQRLEGRDGVLALAVVAGATLHQVSPD